MTTSQRPARRSAARAAAVLLGAAAVVAVPAAAGAHVTVQPDTVEGGGYAVVALRVPNERDDASTTRVVVRLPADQPLGSVQTTPVPGWTSRVVERTLEEPVEVHGEPVERVAARIVWTATGPGVRPGQFQDFAVSMGPLPDSGQLVLATEQVYSSGERVNWNEVAVDESVEPERPAPVLTLAPAADSGQEPAQGPAQTEPSEPTEEPTEESTEDSTEAVSASSDSDPVLPTVLSGAALLVALAALLLALRAARRRNP